MAGMAPGKPGVPSLPLSTMRTMISGLAVTQYESTDVYKRQQNGYSARASELIDKALAFTTHESNREYFEELRSTLGKPPAAGSR